MEQFSSDEKELLARYCTNLDSPIFGLVNLPQVVCGALFSRYSRSPRSVREILLKEFIQNQESGFSEIVCGKGKAEGQIVATKKAEEFYQRVLVGFGDDSVAELGGAHIACEEVSNLATKFIQDARIGISPLEKSTRYVYFDKKGEDGNWRYYRGQEVAKEEIYTKTCDMLFETYAMLIGKVSEFLQKKYPKSDDISERAYKSTIKAKTCDLLRGLLPCSTLTNTGLYGNGRAFEYLLARMYSSGLPELNSIAKSMHSELSKMIPSFVKRANDKHGKQMQEYWEECKRKSREVSGNPPQELEKPAEVELVDYDQYAEQKICAAILFENGWSYMNAKTKAKQMDDKERLKLLEAYVGDRKNRRHKPGRAFEHAYYTFAFCGNFGQFRDLHRHRMLTQKRQLLGCKYGYDMPDGIIEAGLDREFALAMKKAKEAHGLLAKKVGHELAQYVVPMAYRMRWYFHLNLREAFHLIELRSMPQGHEDYRRVAVKMHGLIAKAHPRLAGFMKFVNKENAGLERLEAEKRLDKKIDALKKES